MIVSWREVPDSSERVDGRFEPAQRLLGIGVDQLQQRGIARDEPFEEVDAVLADVVEALPPDRERAGGIPVRVDRSAHPECVRDQPRVPLRARRGDRLVDELQRFLDSSGRLEAVDVAGHAERARTSGERGDPSGELHVLVDVSAVDLRERLDEVGPARLEGVVLRVRLRAGPRSAHGRRPARDGR